LLLVLAHGYFVRAGKAREAGEVEGKKQGEQAHVLAKIQWISRWASLAGQIREIVKGDVGADS
jgi:hypothetical protein